MDSGAVLKEALIGVRRALRDKGFKAKGMTFSRTTEGGNTLLLGLQKSTKSTGAQCQVTWNYGVYCATLGARLQDDAAASDDVARAHWRERLTENGNERWLYIDATDSPEECARMILDATASAIADLERHASNEALRDEWVAGSAPGLGDMERLLYAAILVNEIGPAELLHQLVRALRASVAGGAHEGFVTRQLARAGVQLGT